MHRKLLVGLVSALLLVGIISIAAYAQGTLREYTGYQVMNLATCEGCVAHVRVEYYGPSGGAPVLVKNLDIQPGGSVSVQQKTDDASLPEGVYSAVLSSDQPIAAIVGQVESDPTVSGAIYQAPFSDYTGASAGSRTVTLPVLEYNWYGTDSLIRLQNAGEGTANVTIQYYAGRLGGQPTGAASIAAVNRTIPQYAAITLDQSTMGELAATSGPYQGRFLGSAVVTSDQPLVAVVNETDPTSRLKYTYNGFGTDDAGTELLAPAVFANFFNTLTSLTVANPSTSATVNVSITYTANDLSLNNDGSNAGGRQVTKTFTLAPGEASVRYEGSAALGDVYSEFQRFGGSARITSTGGPVVAKVNQTQYVASGNNQKPSGSYNAVPTNRLTTRVAVPLIQADFYGYYTAITCANTSTSQAANVTIRYTSDNLSARPNQSGQFTHSIPAGGSIIRFEATRNGALADINKSGSPWDTGTTVRFNGSAFVTSSGPAIACVVNEVGTGVQFDNMNTYNGVSLSP